MADVVNFSVERALRADNNALLTPIDALKDAIREIETGERKASSVLILTLDRGESGDEYGTGWYAAKLKSSDMIALLEATKARLLRDMGI